MNKTLIAVGLAVVLIALGVWFFRTSPAQQPSADTTINSYEKCVKAGYPVLETYPEQCKVPDGRTFVREIPANSSSTATSTPVITDMPHALFGIPFTLTIGKAVWLGNSRDGFTVKLNKIDDSRCPQNVQCVWQGELSALFSVTLRGVSADLRLGTVTKHAETLLGYTITLKSATPNSANIVVSIPTPVASGISGFIHMGPVCPVERIPPDPNCADRPYASAKVTIRSKASGSVASESASDATGNFRATLAPGIYTIEVTSPTGASLPRCETQEAVVKLDAVTNVDVSCDSGIR